MEDLDVNAAIRGMSVHLCQDYDQNLRFVKNNFWASLKKLFLETEKLIKNRTEITGVSTFDFEEFTWSATSLLCDKACQITKAKTYVFADSVLCLGGIEENLNEAWKVKIKWYFESDHLKDLNRIDGEPMEFEWKIFPGFTTFGLLEQIRKFMEDRQCEPEQFVGNIIFMSVFNDIAWRGKGNAEKCDKKFSCRLKT